MKRYRFEFCTLRYYHDVWTGEFLNIGVVLLCPDRVYLGWRIDGGIQRPVSTFGHINKELLQGFARDLGNLLKQASLDLQGRSEIPTEEGLLDLVSKLLPEDDSSFQWGPVGGGLTDSPEQEFEKLYERYVGRYEQKSTGLVSPSPLTTTAQSVEINAKSC